MKTLRCAIIGCGPNNEGKGGANSIAYAHAEAMRRVDGVQLIAAASRTEKNIGDFVAEFPDCAPFRDYRAMLRDSKPDLVSVCAFSADREAMVTDAVAAGAKAVWIEKPFAESLGEAQRMMSAAKKAGVRLFVNHQRRYGKPFEWWRDAVQQNRIGDLISVDVVQPFAAIMGFGPHLVDAALFAIGQKRNPKTIFAAVEMDPAGDLHGMPTEKHLLASVQFDDGIRLTIQAGDVGHTIVPVLRAHGTKGFAELRLSPADGDGSIFRANYGDGQGNVSPATDEHFHHTDDKTIYVHRAMIDIAQSLAENKPTRIDAGEAYRGLEILLGAFESARVGKLLEFPIAQDASPIRLMAQKR